MKLAKIFGQFLEISLMFSERFGNETIPKNSEIGTKSLKIFDESQNFRK